MDFLSNRKGHKVGAKGAKKEEGIQYGLILAQIVFR
jgi:hypothetical protein